MKKSEQASRLDCQSRHGDANPAAASVRDRNLTAVSLNLAKETNPDQVATALQAVPRLREADLYLFQEVGQEEGKHSVAEEVAHQFGYAVSFAPAAPGVHDQGLAIVSRYPLKNVGIKRLKACDLRFRSRQRFAMAATAQTPWGDLRVWNVHLDTRINRSERLEQLQPVLDEAARQTGPRLIGGDFNSNNLYWLGNVVPLPGSPAHTTAIRRVMKQHGFETPFPEGLETFPPYRRQLDWIFLNGLKPVEASVEPAPFSDHHAIWVRAQM